MVKDERPSQETLDRIKRHNDNPENAPANRPVRDRGTKPDQKPERPDKEKTSSDRD
jgi:hypothetical protein